MSTPMDTSNGGGGGGTGNSSGDTGAGATTNAGPSPSMTTNAAGATSTGTSPPAPAATAAAANTTNNTTPANKITTTSSNAQDPSTETKRSSSSSYSMTDEAVLVYLKSKGMGSAVLELQAKLKEASAAAATTTSEDAKDPKGSNQRTQSLKDTLEAQDEEARNQRLALTKSTGGGFGYDLDAAVPLVQWGVPDVGAAATTTTNVPCKDIELGVHEAKSYLDAFCALQLWVLTLPEDSNAQQEYVDPIAKAKQIIAQGQSDPNHKVSLSTLLKSISTSSSSSSSPSSPTPDSNSSQQKNQSPRFLLPPSVKPELLAVTFALLVHTYCELLEVGMETTAHVLRDAFAPIYQPLYQESLQDLYQCRTTEDIIKLNTHNSQHMEALQGLKSILVQIASLQLRKEEVSHAQPKDASQQQAQKAKIQEYNQTIALLQQKHNELSKRASQAFDRMYEYPFLRRARAVRWQLTMSVQSYGLLCQFLNQQSLDTSLLSMSTLLQTKCELHVEQRDPLPMTPAVVLDDNRDKRRPDLNETTEIQWAAPLPFLASEHSSSTDANTKKKPYPSYHLKEEYEDERSARHDKRAVEFNRALLIHGFRRLEALERKREYEVMQPAHLPEVKKKTSPTTASSSGMGKSDDKDEGDYSSDHEEGTSSSRGQPGFANPLEPSILLSTLCANHVKEEDSQQHSAGGTSSSSNNALTRKRSNSISAKNTTTSKSRSHHHSSGHGSTGAVASMNFSMWEEAGIGLTCAKLAPPDGRRIAVGCDDAAVRVWDLQRDSSSSEYSKDATREVCQVLLGHKNGFPVFDLSWNRDGRSLLSCGGDGSIRLWDTMAQGPFGEVLDKATVSTSLSSNTKKVEPKTLTNATAKEALSKATTMLQNAKEHGANMDVPGAKPESSIYESGSALAVYRGHAPNTPIWSVAFAPSGYYFASAGADATARLWTTDRPAPVRLFAGHTSDSVHSVAFHPNTNYILTGAEDKTVRLWDIQTGRCVRLLNGCRSGIYQVQVDPSGQYAVGADASGTVHMWDLGTGKKLTEFCAKPMGDAAGNNHSSNNNNNSNNGPTAAGSGAASTPKSAHWGMMHAMSFSACGRALATGGDDQCVRIWDVHSAIRSPSPIVEYPKKSYSTRRTMILDLEFTKRNLLLSVGKYISAVPLVNHISD